MKMENISLNEQLSKWCEITKKNKRVHVTRQAYENYKRSNDYSIYDVYNNPSIYKDRVFKQIMNEMYEHSGYNLKVISYNSHMFTCGYCVDVDGDTYFIRHTPLYRDCVKVD